ncbi:MAG: hypothetical protein M3Y17_14035 [Actinomycetota bacterium]|nr:hypothetical protein [Actinomycetota bacterium]
MIDDKRPPGRPRNRRVRREHHRREHLHPVSSELSVARTTAAGEPPSRAFSRLPVGLSLAQSDERPGDLARREAIATRRLETFVRGD